MTTQLWVWGDLLIIGTKKEARQVLLDRHTPEEVRRQQLVRCDDKSIQLCDMSTEDQIDVPVCDLPQYFNPPCIIPDMS